MPSAHITTLLYSNYSQTVSTTGATAGSSNRSDVAFPVTPMLGPQTLSDDDLVSPLDLQFPATLLSPLHLPSGWHSDSGVSNPSYSNSSTSESEVVPASPPGEPEIEYLATLMYPPPVTTATSQRTSDLVIAVTSHNHSTHYQHYFFHWHCINQYIVQEELEALRTYVRILDRIVGSADGMVTLTRDEWEVIEVWACEEYDLHESHWGLGFGDGSGYPDHRDIVISGGEWAEVSEMRLESSGHENTRNRVEVDGNAGRDGQGIDGYDIGYLNGFVDGYMQGQLHGLVIGGMDGLENGYTVGSVNGHVESEVPME